MRRVAIVVVGLATFPTPLAAQTRAQKEATDAFTICREMEQFGKATACWKHWIERYRGSAHPAETMIAEERVAEAAEKESETTGSLPETLSEGAAPVATDPQPAAPASSTLPGNASAPPAASSSSPEAQPSTLATAPPTQTATPTEEERSASTLSKGTVERPWTVHGSRWILGAERVVGVEAWSEVVEGNGRTLDSSGTALNFLGTTTAVTGGSVGINPFSIPRVTADLLDPTGLTLGAFLVYTSVSGSTKVEITDDALDDELDGATVDWPDFGLFFLGARVGYLRVVAPDMSLWVRAGLGYLSLEASGATGTATASAIVGSVEPMLVWTFAPHVGLVFGASLDTSFSGGIEAEVNDSGTGVSANVSDDLSLVGYGVSAGVSIFL